MCDFHSLNYLEYAYLQLGRFRDAQHTVDIIAAQYQALPNKKTARDTPELQSRHVRGRTIYAVPDRVVYGYFDMLTRLLVEAGRWDEAGKIPLLVSSRDFPDLAGALIVVPLFNVASFRQVTPHINPVDGKNMKVDLLDHRRHG